MTIKIGMKAATVSLVAVALLGCSGGTDKAGEGSKPATEIAVDGSSTVSPIMEAVAEEFGAEQPNVKLTVSTSGTGGGFKKFANGEIDIADASRPIKPEEIEAAKKNGIDFIEVPIAFDGLTVVVNPKNTFADTLTVEELKKIWEPNSKVKTWADVRPGFPKEEIKLYGAGTDSGTFDYFTKAIVGEEKSSRSDYQASEDDNTLVQGVAGDQYALGYFGFAYYEQNKDKLKVVKIDAGKGGIAPTTETITDGTYAPLSRPLFIYLSVKALEKKPAMAELVWFLFGHGNELISSTGYVPLPAEANKMAMDRVEQKKTGSVFHGSEVGVRIEDVLQREASH
jgi:phosphate transport system substrate-binding protein